MEVWLIQILCKYVKQRTIILTQKLYELPIYGNIAEKYNIALGNNKQWNK